MVFSSIPAYLDPSNWQQQQNHQNLIGASSSANPLLPPPPPQQAPPPPPQPHGGGVRPGSMSERARLANIPLPEAALKCPRCESTNTKFCYFNNYSLSQPRHFCKTCRRYWTRGGALRNVPVGGGCRRNKRSKSSSNSKSPASSERHQTNNNPSSTSSMSLNSGGAASMLELTPPPQLPPLRFMSPLGQLSTDNFAGDMGLSNYGGMTSAQAVGTNEMNFNTSNLIGHGGGAMPSFLSSEVQQFPFFGGLDQSSAGIYQFHGGESGFMGGGGGIQQTSNHHQMMRPKVSSSSVKMEDNNNTHEMSLSRQLLGGMQGNNNDHHQQWNNSNAASWTELSSFSSSSTSNPL